MYGHSPATTLKGWTGRSLVQTLSGRAASHNTVRVSWGLWCTSRLTICLWSFTLHLENTQSLNCNCVSKLQTESAETDRNIAIETWKWLRENCHVINSIIQSQMLAKVVSLRWQHHCPTVVLDKQSTNESSTVSWLHVNRFYYFISVVGWLRLFVMVL